MIEGMLVINLEPPYIGFSESSDAAAGSGSPSYEWRHCSQDDIRDLLIELGVISTTQSWPPRECLLRLTLPVPKKALKRLGLANLHELKALRTPAREAALQVS